MVGEMLTCFLFLFIYIPTRSLCDSVLGCGGFVKSDVEINFSLVEMKLYTLQGSIKYQTDCAPNNGYYLVPLYDKGDFILQVEPPPGWSFEPESVRLHVDGSTDKCSLGEDINFQFKGFSIRGMVLSKGEKTGPGNVKLSLMTSDGSEVLQTTVSKEGDFYYFRKVLPGDYIIKGQHPIWKFEKSEIKVTVGSDNVFISEDLVVAGYDVNGHVFSEGEPIKGVNFLLYSDTVDPQLVTDCEKTPVKSLKNGDNSICHMSSKEDGTFSFASLPTGQYYLIPFYKGEHITFDVVPEKMVFQVKHNSVILPKEFQVAGFSVSGRILDSVKGAGIGGAKVSVSGKQMAVTNEDGSYHLENMKAGKYTIQVMSEDIFFDEIMLKITPNTPHLHDIIASRFSVCGKVNIDEIPKGLDHMVYQRKVIAYTEDKAVKLLAVDTDMQGHFCAMFKPGKYIFKAFLSTQEIKAGLHLYPSEKLVVVTNKPVKDVDFSQFRAKVSGVITCIENCGTIGLSLDPIGMVGEDKKVVMLKDSPKKASFEFENILPGKYKVAPLQDNWCWKEKSQEIEITNKDVTGLEFSQTGFILKCGLSHEITLNFAHENKEGSVGSFALKKGTNRFCLSQPGVYRLTTDSCHRFEKDIYTYDTSHPVVLSLTAVKHKMVGIITTEKLDKTIVVTLKSSLLKSPIVIGPLECDNPPKKESSDSEATDSDTQSEPAQTSFQYHFSYWAKNNEHLEIQVASDVLLFSPNHMEVTIQGESCPGEVAHFVGKVGIFITGMIEPALQGVTVVVSCDDPVTMAPTTLLTDQDGVYRLGPLHGDKKYSVEASKTGYVLTKDPQNPNNFKALQLGEISVTVVDENNNYLSSVLLSLSGDNQYRSNNLIKENGIMVFSSLSPGRYFLRPMMKEYRFEPASQMISVEEGTRINVNIKGFREAYSCYGRVSSLNGEPEPGVLVEAVSVSGSVQYQEESKTEQDGTYRIRGLSPNVTYKIQLKKVENNHLERSAPKSSLHTVENEDLVNVNIIAFRRLNQMDISGNVITPNEFLSHLKVVLYKDESPDSPTYSVTLGATSFFYLPSLPTDHKGYNLRLESSLSRSMYDYQLPEYNFVADTAYKHFTFKFEPKRRLLDQDLNQTSFLLLPFALLVLGAIYMAYKFRHNLSKISFIDIINQARNLVSQVTAEPSNPVITETLLAPENNPSKRRFKSRKSD
ncbi:nodal modulator 1 [Octopus sinensis]|uniref:Nodal modulator 1 n=1 Tax=Octopus sinensis TaxID=2607531 RepID=A0A6P7T9E2_9MOLL|nr:nodal modulator 1 [Octopus sinensis]